MMMRKEYELELILIHDNQIRKSIFIFINMENIFCNDFRIIFQIIYIYKYKYESLKEKYFSIPIFENVLFI